MEKIKEEEEPPKRRVSIEHEDPSIVAFSENKNMKSDNASTNGKQPSDKGGNSDSPTKGSSKKVKYYFSDSFDP